ncbi:MAG: ABC transporter permease [Saprospiraceae bacterium]
MNWYKYAVRKTVQSILMLLFLSLIGHWIITNIPGSYNDFIQLENEATNSEQLQQKVISAKPLFYFGIMSEFSEEEKKNPSSIHWSKLMPNWKWNGLKNRYHEWLSGSGISMRDSKKVSDKVWDAISWTVIIQLPVLIIIFFMGLFLAEWSVRTKAQKLVEVITRILSIFHSIPIFWFANLLLIFFAGVSFLNILPSSFVHAEVNSPLEFWFGKSYYLILPIISLVLPSLAIVFNLTRISYLEHMDKLSWKRMLASGISKREGIIQEARPQAIIPLVAWFASAIPLLISGSIIIENIFSIPGTGRLLFQSIGYRDWPVVHALFMMSAIMTLLGIILAEILQMKLDPRINLTE